MKKNVLTRLTLLQRHIFYIVSRYSLLYSPRSTQFKKIYHSGGFGNSESRSGEGSDLEATKAVRESLPRLFKKYHIVSLLDIPCGDWFWMQHLDLSAIEYIGADIVDDIIRNNKNKFATKNISFKVIDLVVDNLPQVDLVLCRDCLIHLKLQDAQAAIQNIKRSGSKFLLTTTYTSLSKNQEIGIQFFRPINLQAAPFNFPQPIALISEKWRNNTGAYADKSLGLWRISDL